MHGTYRRLLFVLSVSGVVMYFVMYAMLWRADHFYFSLNRVYMTLLMVAPMGSLMLLAMPSMYPHRKANLGLHASFALLFLLCLAFVRTQTPLGDRQFLRAMIPHHSGAILMCKESSLHDPDIRRLCEQIVRSQRKEIAEMEALLAGETSPSTSAGAR